MDEWDTMEGSDDASGFVSSESQNHFSTHTQSVSLQALPAPLAAPPGWRSQIIDSNAPLSIDTEVNQIRTNNNIVVNNYEDGYRTNNRNIIENNYQDYYTTNRNSNFVDNYQDYYATNAYNGAHINRTAPRVVRNVNQYGNARVNDALIYGQQSYLTEQQQRNIIHTVEHQNPPPVVIHKRLPNDVVTYKKNIFLRYLKPPTPPPPGPLIIREVRPPAPPPPPPLQIRQRPPPPPQQPPIVLRERPPPLPPQIPPKVVEKLLPPPPPPPRRVVVERFAPCPPKPADVIIERWLPYKQSPRRRVLVERAPTAPLPAQEPNLLILHDAPQARVEKEYINEGVVRVDPDYYLRRYGAEADTWNTRSRYSYLADEATRAVPPPVVTSDRHYRDDTYVSYGDEYRRALSPYRSSRWDRTRVDYSIPRSASYHYDYSSYDSPYSYDTSSSRRYGLGSYRYYDDYYPSRRDDYVSMADVTSSWRNYCDSSSYYPHSSSHRSYSSSYYPYSSYYPERTIRVGSDSEFQNVLADLTHGRVSSGLYSY